MPAILAFSVPPFAASAAEFNGTCSVAACRGTVESNEVATFEAASGLSMKCDKTTGTAVQNIASATGTVQLLFHDCSEEMFGSLCSSVGQPNGTITTSALVSHLVVLEANPKTVGVLLTGVNVTMFCLFTVTLTGNIIGEISNPQCALVKATTSVRFAAGGGTGSQRWTQITTTGTVFGLTTNNDAGGAYEGTSQTGEEKIKWGGNVTLDC